MNKQELEKELEDCRNALKVACDLQKAGQSLRAMRLRWNVNRYLVALLRSQGYKLRKTFRIIRELSAQTPSMSP